MIGLEEDRAAGLRAAEAKAIALFEEVIARGVLAPGVSERAASDAVRDLAAELYGMRRHWHKRIVRGGPNTLEPYARNPPDRILEADDIAFLDFGPIFEAWEADVGRTYVLGADPVKHRLVADLADVWAAGRAWFEASPDVTGAALHARMHELAADAGWELGGTIAGHLVGEFPHETFDPARTQNMIMPGSDRPMRRPLPSGRTAHWILEVHLIDRDRAIGGFYEQLLTL